MMSTPTDVVKALSLAGGLTPYAEENNIIVLRGNGAQQKVISVQYGDIKEGENLQSNVILNSGDVIIVP